MHKLGSYIQWQLMLLGGIHRALKAASIYQWQILTYSNWNLQLIHAFQWPNPSLKLNMRGLIGAQWMITLD